ncbi:protein sidekick-1-like [Oculina patagonica]
MLTLQLALEDGAFLGSPGVIDEDACETDVTDKFICEVPKNPVVSGINYHAATISMETVSVPTHDKYFYGYCVLFKNLDDPNSSWRIHYARTNVPPIAKHVHPLIPYTNYSFRVSAASFKSAGLISEALPRIRTTQWVPAVGPAILAYRNLSSTSIYVQWDHSIPQQLWRGILIGYRVAWSEDHFSSSHPHNSGGYVDVGLDVSNYTVTSLHENWLYDISVAGRTSVGAGIYTRVTLMTDDDVPSEPPSDIQLDMVNETTLNASWNEVDLIHQNGVILGYRLRFQQEDGGPVLWSKTLAPNVSMYIIPDLLIFQNYSIQLMAFTIKGDGPWSEKVYQMTDESSKFDKGIL